MTEAPDRNDLMSPDECWRRLASERIGRLAFDTGGAPAIVPVNHVVRDRVVYFRTGPGQKVMGSSAHPQVAFEVDGRDGERFWSVVVQGRARILGDDDDRLGGVLDDLVSLHPSPKHMVIEVTPDGISGVSFPPPRPGSLWGT